jgi:hypothetical protein
MGEVYRARDTRLGRDVAIKVLPEAFAQDPERLRRFDGEARAASALSDPHIVTVFDIGREAGIAWFATELVEGTDLRALMDEAMPVRKTIDLAGQIASGLAAAHEKGIVHRDLKPENVLISRAGLAKIADFGLAKLTEDAAGGSQLPTSDGHRTAEGVVMGTIAYMSPEQARGATVDFRSDQFSLGSILYEMLTGKIAFHRLSAAETLSAILRDEPDPLPESMPVTLRWIVERCLAKEPQDRYAATRDLAHDLERLRTLSGSGATSAATAPASASSRSNAPFWIAAGIALLAAGTALYFALRPAPPPPAYQQLTFRHGDVVRAYFAPDGQTILYSATWEQGEPKTYLTRTNERDSTPLALPSGLLFAISPSGKVAIGIGPDGDTLAETSLAAAPPRALAEKVDFADYQPGTEKLAASRNGRIEFPIGKVLYDPGPGGRVVHLRFSPRGDSIAFREDRAGASSICLVDLAGHGRVLSGGWSDLIGLAWNPTKNEIWFTAREGPKAGVLVLHAVTPSGRRRLVAGAPGILILKDIARDGRVLLARWDARLSALFQPQTGPARDLSWYGFSVPKALSPDGKTMLFDEDDVVYVRPTDGISPAVRLGEGIAQDLSPDGKWALALPVANPDHLLLLPTGAGETKSLDTGGVTCQYAAFFPDGKRIVLAGAKKGEHRRLYVLPVSGGSPLAVSPDDVGLALRIPPDGKHVPGWARPRALNLYPADGSRENPRTIPGVGEDENPQSWDSTGRFLFLVKGSKILRFDISTGRKEPWMDLSDSAEGGVVDGDSVQLTPDGRFCAFTRFHSASELYLATGLR